MNASADKLEVILIEDKMREVHVQRNQLGKVIGPYLMDNKDYKKAWKNLDGGNCSSQRWIRKGFVIGGVLYGE